MIGFLVTMLLESYRAPRVAMRRVLDMIESFEGVALLFGVSFTVNTLLVLLIAEMAGQGGADFGYFFSNFAFSLFGYLVAVTLIYWIGKLFGGRGRLLDISTAVAWHSLVTVIFAPVVAFAMLPGVAEGHLGLLAVGQIVMVGVVLWLMANFVAEAHGFVSALRVSLGLFGGVFVLGFLVSMLLPSLVTLS